MSRLSVYHCQLLSLLNGSATTRTIAGIIVATWKLLQVTVGIWRNPSRIIDDVRLAIRVHRYVLHLDNRQGPIQQASQTKTASKECDRCAKECLKSRRKMDG